jgi:hypothetical protein
MNWRKAKKLWKKAHVWHIPKRDWKGQNGSNKSLRTMWLIAGIRPGYRWQGVEKRTMEFWA